jgi:hypothetical protein
MSITPGSLHLIARTDFPAIALSENTAQPPIQFLAQSLRLPLHHAKPSIISYQKVAFLLEYGQLAAIVRQPFGRL